MNTRLFFVTFALLLTAVSIVVWATDFVTLEGEWTIYTAKCSGAWKQSECTGSMQSADRFKFRALKAHREVLFWTAGEEGESGRFLKCTIKDGRNWTCPPAPGAPPTITRRMTRGIPDPDTESDGLPFHRVPKWKWVAMKYGVPVGVTAAN